MTKPQDKTILVVEDEPDVQIYLSTILEDAGFNVLTAGDGEEALKTIQEKKPDFISLDMILPKLSGHKLLKKLKTDKELSHIPVLVVTAHAKDDLGKGQLENILDDVLLEGPGVYMEKPVNPRNYVRCIMKALDIEPDDSVDDKLELKEELQGLVQDADPEAMRKAMELLKKKKG